VTHRFTALVTECGLPPVRLHDLRHGTAMNALHGAASLHTAQYLLGHSSHAFTADLYGTVPDALAWAEAASTADTVLTLMHGESGAGRHIRSMCAADVLAGRECVLAAFVLPAHWTGLMGRRRVRVLDCENFATTLTSVAAAADVTEPELLAGLRRFDLDAVDSSMDWYGAVPKAALASIGIAADAICLVLVGFAAFRRRDVPRA